MRNTLAVAIGCLFGIALAVPNARAQQFAWAKQFGGANNDGAYGMALDSSGNVYTVGNFSGTVDFDPGDGVWELPR